MRILGRRSGQGLTHYGVITGGVSELGGGIESSGLNPSDPLLASSIGIGIDQHLSPVIAATWPAWLES
ncbi:hypothetical protein [Streptomyces sp. NPDC047071]|uniref:hypothetical protein n=1 Tax=Streptomyces sp. NPDC047071 TaxID=3154808 RepID=UPI0034541762